MQKRTGRFMATDDNGRQYNVDIYTDFVNVGNFESPNAVVEGLKELRTADGMAVGAGQRVKVEYAARRKWAFVI